MVIQADGINADRRCLAAAASGWGRFDILVYNAGATKPVINHTDLDELFSGRRPRDLWREHDGAVSDDLRDARLARCGAASVGSQSLPWNPPLSGSIKDFLA
jgi:hypothetical protein